MEHDLKTTETKLRDYLLNKVIENLSGRHDYDLVGKPSHLLYAGVLKPQISSSATPLEGNNYSSSSSLGMDFRVCPKDINTKIQLRIKVSWNVYYPVYPSWSIIEKEYIGFENKTPDVVMDIEGEGTRKDVIILPSVFRKKHISDLKLVDMATDNGFTKCFSFESLISDSCAEILQDEDMWHHIGQPNKREREIGTKSEVYDEKSYLNKLNIYKNNNELVELPEWKVSLNVEVKPDTLSRTHKRIKVYVVNETKLSKYDDFILVEPAIFDANLNVEIDNVTLEPFNFHLAKKDYRSKPYLVAKGINCAVMKNGNSPLSLHTETLPIYNQPLYRSRDENNIKFSLLCEKDIFNILDSTIEKMSQYAQEWDEYLNSSAIKELSNDDKNKCLIDKKNYMNEIESCKLGIKALKNDNNLFKAFQFMNKTFLLISENKKINSWRPFQICFILSQLPSLAFREASNSENSDYYKSLKKEFHKVDVLWFPTGGGKTEAYLGLIATALIYDRLRGKNSGVCTWMRFPLRMLSLQQMERLAIMIAALNILRSKEQEVAKGDPFSIGYFVGNNVTPNQITDRDMQEYSKNSNLRDRIRLLRKCPFCESGVDISTNQKQWRLMHTCRNPECFSNTSDSLGYLKGSLPLFVIDNELYRYTPSVIVGTIDKLAIAGMNKYFKNILLGSHYSCPQHGLTVYDECVEQYTAKCNNTKKRFNPVNSYKDPGPSILLQDELHLLKAELGVFNGHYEGFLQFIGEKTYLPPKILAATATIESYEKHIFHLYLKDASRFPQPSWKKGYSFYAETIEDEFRRKFVGVLCHARSIENAGSRILEIYQKEIFKLLNNTNLINTVCSTTYNNEILKELLYLYDISLAYVNRKATGSSLLYRLNNITFSRDENRLDSIDCELLTGDLNQDDIAATLERIEKERNEVEGKRLSVVAATSLISHGVDLERFNMMTICGMPSHFAEFLQSSSRCARSHAGSVFVCFNSKDPRETSQYEFFIPMLENIDNLIEPVAVNRFSSFAPVKTIPGLLSAIFLHYLSPKLLGNQINKPLSHVPTLQVALGLKPATSVKNSFNCISQEELLSYLEAIVGVDNNISTRYAKESYYIKERIKEIFEDQIALIARTHERNLNQVLDQIISFRDVDQGLGFASPNSSSVVSNLRG